MHFFSSATDYPEGHEKSTTCNIGRTVNVDSKKNKDMNNLILKPLGGRFIDPMRHYAIASPEDHKSMAMYTLFEKLPADFCKVKDFSRFCSHFENYFPPRPFFRSIAAPKYQPVKAKTSKVTENPAP